MLKGKQDMDLFASEHLLLCSLIDIVENSRSLNAQALIEVALQWAIRKRRIME